MQPKVSIVIPVYNVQEYIVNCLESVYKQDFQQEIELILVDDCGKDDSMKIAVEFCNSKKRCDISAIFLYSECNKGQSAARNTGLRVASGEYIYFLDSDDYISPDCISLLYDSFQQNADADMVLGNYNYSEKGKYKLLSMPDGIYSDCFLDCIIEEKIYTTPHNKLVRKNFLLDNGLFFKEGLFHEDFLWLTCCACHIGKFVVVDKPLYMYVIRNGSTERQSSWAFHKRNYFLALMGIKDYLLKNYKRTSQKEYSWLTKREEQWFVETLWKGEVGLTYEFYDNIRKCRSWSLIDIIKFSDTYYRLVQHIHRLLPYKFGFYLYRKVTYKIIMNEKKHEIIDNNSKL